MPEDPKPAKIGAPKPPPDLPTNPPPSPAVAGDGNGNAKELEALRGEVAKLRAREMQRVGKIRKLAAAILTPAEEADKGASRQNNIREKLTALCEELFPEAP